MLVIMPRDRHWYRQRGRTDVLDEQPSHDYSSW